MGNRRESRWRHTTTQSGGSEQELVSQRNCAGLSRFDDPNLSGRARTRRSKGALLNPLLGRLRIGG